MNEKLIAGYAAYTNADEFAANVLDSAPATIEIISLTVASFVASAETYDIKC
ncbi:LxmA leader domain family RiPP [Streptomyces sp. NPDC060048]|uniref:LxmA leader domain family RiPP n=1 Tax=unclassified Streptomyces TaxID=2593676 RepID=UPI001BEB767F|nr:LxmA leader domain family RiPP [Streptomyces sp. ISL-43]MBT2446166.1 LxmA leader domain family RiPP [Streptomyces sp. ISL-43]